ncbi:MAG: periplasmic heavy metal sensor [Blastocatellia bacterium]|nr:periplasmic heavy metal sensor [Blastocatellia bacterium]
MKPKIVVLCAFMFLAAQSLMAQHPQPQPHPHPQPDPMGDNFFPPELVMHNQQAIGLTEEQRNYIHAEIQKTHEKFTNLQWQIANELETMSSLVKQDRVDEEQTLAQLDKILNLEREIKRTHIALAVRIKNRLTAEQQARLREIKTHHRR